MTYLNTPTSLLPHLLSRFVKIDYLSLPEQELFEDYILAEVPVKMLGQDDSEIYETVDFLRDLAQDAGFTSLQQLDAYFEDREEKLKALVEPLLQADSLNHSQLLFIKTAFATVFKTELGKIFLNNYVTAGPSFTSAGLLEKWYESLPDATHCINDERFRSLNLWQYCVQRLFAADNSKAILPNSDPAHFKMYFQQFVPKQVATNRVIYFFKRIRTWLNLHRIKQYLMDRSSLKQVKKQQVRTTEILQDIARGLESKGVSNKKDLKHNLRRIILQAKINNPIFRERHLELQSKKPIAVRQYFQYLNKRKWAILKSPEGQSWITTDNPGFSIDLETICSEHKMVVPDPYWTAMTDLDVIYYPLSVDYCLRLVPDGLAHAGGQLSRDDGYIEFINCSSKETATVNTLAQTASTRVVLSETKGIRMGV